MKKLISLGVVTLLLAMTATTLSGSWDRGGSNGVKDRFVGAWRLVSLEAPGPTGKLKKPTPPECLSSRATATRRFR
jgi:hypothetical protein